jgi:FlaA1/EpsC-like NDP-sugar epimerase
MRDDDLSGLRESLALVRLAWPQLVTMFSFLFAVLLRYPVWFVALTVLVVAVSVSRVAADVAKNPGRSFDFAAIDYLLVGAGWAASLLSMRWWYVERAQQLESGALLTQASRTILIATPELAWCSVVTQCSR